MTRCAARLGLLALLAASPLPGVGPADGRVVVDGAAAPWTSLARLQVPGVLRCTAVAVAPRLLLTAAHCLWDRRMRRFVSPDQVHVLARYDAEHFSAHEIAAALRILPGYDPLQPAATGAADAALVVLAAPLAGAVPLRLAPMPAPGTAAMLGGYNQDRAEVIEADTACHVVGANSALLLHDCAATHGTSGAPLLVQDAAGAWRVAGIQSAAFIGRNGGVAVPAEKLQAWLAAAETAP